MSDYPEHIDLMWLAVDMEGYVAGLTTGGMGPIPFAALKAQESDELGMALSGMPITSAARLEVKYSRPNDFVDLAERGWFAYDWGDVHRVIARYVHVYERIAVPTKPITLEALPEQLRTAVASVRLPISFAMNSKIDVRSLSDCAESRRH